MYLEIIYSYRIKGFVCCLIKVKKLDYTKGGYIKIIYTKNKIML